MSSVADTLSRADGYLQMRRGNKRIIVSVFSIVDYLTSTSSQLEPRTPLPKGG